MVKVNGKSRDVSGLSVSKCLELLDYDVRTVVVERNMEIVPKTEYDTTLLQENDEIEIVSFMGGG